MNHRIGCSLLALALAAGLPHAALAQTTGDAPAAAPAPVPVPAQRPNMLVWMLDDVGFAQLSSFGGLVETPNIDRVAMRGLRYTNYRTAPICSASRAALLTGRNPHSVHIGGHAAAAVPIPGHDGKIPAEDGTIAANLRQAGYQTMALGKWDHLPSAEMTSAGPFTRWPAGQGFDKFYGFLSADADNWNPPLIEGTQPVRTPEVSGYHLNADLADRAIAMIGDRHSREVPPPFFMYFATGTAHAPHHAPQAWVERYKGKFDMGWDKAREAILKREIAQGLIPKGTKLAPRPEGMPAWDSLTPDEKRLYARQMEVFAAALGHADAEFGRIFDALEQSGELDNTIVVVTSDNGASSEGAFSGTYNEALFTQGKYPTAAENLPFIDKWGGPETYPHYSFGWAVAGNTPFRYFKQTTHEGGIHVPLVVSWPKGIAARGELRDQFVSVDDVAPTLLDLADAKAPDQVKAQYFELYGNKALWSDGWTIVTSHRLDPWRMDQAGAANEPWELYDLKRDPGQTADLAAKYPDKVTAMAAMFDEQAKAHNVYPLTNFPESRAIVAREFRAEMGRRKGKWAFPRPVSHIGYAAVPPLALRPFTMTARVDPGSANATGPIFAIGGAMGGMGLYLKDGTPAFVMRDLAGGSTVIAADRALPAGATDLVLTLDRPAPSPLSPEAVTVTITAGGQIVARKDMTVALPGGYGVGETFDIGIDWGSAVSPDYAPGQAFPGTIGKVEFDFR